MCSPLFLLPGLVFWLLIFIVSLPLPGILVPNKVDLLAPRKRGYTWCKMPLSDHVGWRSTNFPKKCWSKFSVVVPPSSRYSITGSDDFLPVSCIVSEQIMNGACSAFVENCTISIMDITTSRLSCYVYWYAFGWNLSIGWCSYNTKTDEMCNYIVYHPFSEDCSPY